MPISWIADQITTWLGWLTAIAVLIGAAFALHNHTFDQAAYLGVASLLIAALNCWRHAMLQQRKAEFLAATMAYEKAIRSAFG